jgi:hypothetical protein
MGSLLLSAANEIHDTDSESSPALLLRASPGFTACVHHGPRPALAARVARSSGAVYVNLSGRRREPTRVRLRPNLHVMNGLQWCAPPRGQVRCGKR